MILRFQVLLLDNKLLILWSGEAEMSPRAELGLNPCFWPFSIPGHLTLGFFPLLQLCQVGWTQVKIASSSGITGKLRREGFLKHLMMINLIISSSHSLGIVWKMMGREISPEFYWMMPKPERIFFKSVSRIIWSHWNVLERQGLTSKENCHQGRKYPTQLPHPPSCSLFPPEENLDVL